MKPSRILPALVPAVAAPAWALAGPDGAYGRGYGHMWDGGWGGAFMGFGAMLIFWVLVIAGIVLAVRWLAGDSPRGRQDEDSALRILRERLARGEIDADEYEARKKALES